MTVNGTKDPPLSSPLSILRLRERRLDTVLQLVLTVLYSPPRIRDVAKGR
jgi:hypothetical protein